MSGIPLSEEFFIVALHCPPSRVFIFTAHGLMKAGSGNGTLLISMPPAGLTLTTLLEDASALTPTQNAMWATRMMTVANNQNGQINAFIRGLNEDNNHEVLVLINQNGGPRLAPGHWGDLADGAGKRSWSCKHGCDPPSPTPTVPAGAGPAVSLNLMIRGDRFNPVNLSVPAGSRVTLTYDDQDLNPHNFALYPSMVSSDPILRSPVISRRVVETYTFTAPATPGTCYYGAIRIPGLIGTFTVTSPPATTATTTAPTGGTPVPLTLTATNFVFDRARSPFVRFQSCDDVYQQ